MKKSRWSLLLAVPIVFGFALVKTEAEPAPGVRKFMRPKLDHAQKVLEGLALEDFEMIGKNANALLRLSEAAEWQVLPSPEYVRHSEEFQRVTNDLIRAANNKNLDSATLAYVQLTMNCVSCHKHVREARRVALAQ